MNAAEKAEGNVSASGADEVEMDRKETIAGRIAEQGRGVSPSRKAPAAQRTPVAPADSRIQPLRFYEDTAWDEV